MITSSTTMSNFAKNLSLLMAKKGMNQVELAKLSGIQQPLISSYINGSPRAKYPSLKSLVKLAQVLNCTLEELTGIATFKDIEKKSENLVLSENAKKLLDKFNKLAEGDQFLIENMILSLSDKKK